MWRTLTGLVEAPIRAMAQQIAIPALSILIAAVLFLIALLALLSALFLWLSPIVGAIFSALLVAATALILAGIALLPVLLRRRPAPKQQAAPAFVDLATLLPLVPNLVKLRPLLVGALLVALFVTLTAKPADGDKDPEA
jgi:uncharacterized membrane protein YedE/YeeE